MRMVNFVQIHLLVLFSLYCKKFLTLESYATLPCQKRRIIQMRLINARHHHSLPQSRSS